MRITMIVAAAAGLLAACAGYAPPNDMRGMTEAEVVQAMGPPTGRYQLPEGPQRLEFARGPYGRHTYMVDLDAQGRVLKWEQVLDRRYFEVVTPGMTSEQLLRFIGRPSERMGMMRNGQIWSWRYYNTECLWWQAQLNAEGVVTAAGYGILPQCDGGLDGQRR
ncbi:MAG TPA: hypothetical protein VLJ62_09060 [Burkholderiaceae bacterium]|nr:hypothetical protein [Burkholderiaceae bacterium]